MERNQDQDRNLAGSRERSGGEREIDERLTGERDADQEDIVNAANEGFVRDQQSADHPSRIKRELADGEDPAHSRGSGRQRS